MWGYRVTDLVFVYRGIRMLEKNEAVSSLPGAYVVRTLSVSLTQFDPHAPLSLAQRV